MTPTIGTAGSSFGTAADLGAVFPIAQGTQNLNISGNVLGSPVTVVYPGGLDDPGSRNIPVESHLLAGTDTSGVIPVFEYNFKSDIGTVLG